MRKVEHVRIHLAGDWGAAERPMIFCRECDGHVDIGRLDISIAGIFHIMPTCGHSVAVYNNSIVSNPITPKKALISLFNDEEFGNKLRFVEKCYD